MREAIAAGDRLLRTKDMARWLTVSKSTLVRWRQSGEGPAVYWLAEGVPRYRKQRLSFDERGYDPSAGKVAVEDALPNGWSSARAGSARPRSTPTATCRRPRANSREPASASGPAVVVSQAARCQSQRPRDREVAGRPRQARLRADDGEPLPQLALVLLLLVRVRGPHPPNPVAAIKPPKDRRAREDMRPLPGPELDKAVTDQGVEPRLRSARARAHGASLGRNADDAGAGLRRGADAARHPQPARGRRHQGTEVGQVATSLSPTTSCR